MSSEGSDALALSVWITCRMHYLARISDCADGSDCMDYMVLSADEHTECRSRFVLNWGVNVGVAPRRYVHLTATACYDGSCVASRLPVFASDRTALFRGFLLPCPKGRLYHTWHLVVAVHNLEYNCARVMVDTFRLSGSASCFQCSDGSWVAYGVHSSMVAALRRILHGGGAPISVGHPAYLVVQTHGVGAVLDRATQSPADYISL